VPVPEIDVLHHFWQNYAGLRESFFTPRPKPEHGTLYADFTPALKEKRAIAEVVNVHPGVLDRQKHFMAALNTWWQQHLPLVEALAWDPENKQARPHNVYEMRAKLLESMERTFAGQHLLTHYQVRGAFANYYNLLAADFKSIAASGWGPELIPDEEILQSQFPQVLAELEQQHGRLTELQALFAAAGEEDFEDTEDTGVLPPDDVKSLKANLKEAKGLRKAAKKDPAFGDWKEHEAEIQRLEKQLARHKTLEDEAKLLKTLIRSSEAKKEELVEAARARISRDEARRVIVERLGRVLFESYRHYLGADHRACVVAIENLWSKYAETVKKIEVEREGAMQTLKAFLLELGYA
jgi:type I restriction enzyme M protein